MDGIVQASDLGDVDNVKKEIHYIDIIYCLHISL
uniref:Uncharacterized protein n=1 Tax=Arundo donax TaxID=35708 RepID=A0A0A8XQJ8_ARUDO